MPEVVSKYPDATLQVLQSAGARCGEGSPQRILTACPQERFCALPGGEICVYGITEIAQATQLAPKDFPTVAAAPGAPAPGEPVAPAPPGIAGLTTALLVVGAFFLGAFVARLVFRRKAA